jgi:hypothetical protein
VETVAAGVGRPHGGISEQIRRSACAVEHCLLRLARSRRTRALGLTP